MQSTRTEAEIFVAIRNNNFKEVEKLVRSGVDITIPNADKQKPIELARKLDLWDCVRAIARNKKDVDGKADYGSPLVTSVSNDDYDTAKLLLENGATQAWRSIEGSNYCLHWAMLKKNIKMLKLLLEYNGDLSDTNKANQTPLQLAISLKFWEGALSIVKKEKTAAAEVAEHPEVLFAAIKSHNADDCNNLDVIVALITAGADINAINDDKKTPIQLANKLNLMDCVKTIAKNKKDVDGKAKYGDPLLDAVKNDDYDLAKLLINNGAPLSWHSNIDKFKNYYCLHFAVHNKNIKMLELLLDHDGDLTDTNEAKQTPMQLAVANGFWEGVKTIATKKNTDKTDAAKYTEALFAAIKAHNNKDCNNLEVIAALIKAGADITATNEENLTPIQVAKNLDYWDCVQTIAINKKDVDGKAMYGSALLKAVRYNKYDIAKTLLENGANQTRVSTDEPYEHYYCLHWAIHHKSLKMVKLLSQYKPILSQINNDGQTPIEFACAQAQWEIAEFLLKDKTFKFNDSAKAGLAVIDAIKAGRLDIAQSLLAAGASINEKDKVYGYSALHWAIHNKNTNAISFLLENKISQTLLNLSNETAVEFAIKQGYWDGAQKLIEHEACQTQTAAASLHYEQGLIHAIKSKNIAIIKLLLKHHAPCSQWNSEMGNIALYWTVKMNIPEIIPLLINAGANPNIVNQDGKTTLDLANKLKYFSCANALQNLSDGENFQTQIENADNLFTSLMENGVKREDISDTIQELKYCHGSILSKDRANLIKQREQLKKGNLQSTSQIFLTEALHILIKTINALLNYQEQGIPLTDLQVLNHPEVQQQFPEAIHILTAISHKEKMNNYIGRIQQWLQQEKLSLVNEHWKIKNIWAWFDRQEWVDGKPKHVGQMEKVLEKLSTVKKPMETLEIFNQYIEILSNITTSKRRHIHTTEYYTTKISDSKAITFDTPVMYYYPYALPSSSTEVIAHNTLPNSTASQMYPYVTVSAPLMSQPTYANMSNNTYYAPVPPQYNPPISNDMFYAPGITQCSPNEMLSISSGVKPEPSIPVFNPPSDPQQKLDLLVSPPAYSMPSEINQSKDLPLILPEKPAELLPTAPTPVYYSGLNTNQFFAQFPAIPTHGKVTSDKQVQLKKAANAH